MPKRKFTVRFNAEWRSDGGLRVYTTDPTGLYVSSQHTYAAAEYFERFMVVLVAHHDQGKNAGLMIDYDFDWNSIIAAGGGACEFETLTEKEMEEEGASPTGNTGGDFPPFAGEEETPLAENELHVDNRTRNSKLCLVIHDFGESDPVLEEVIRRQTVQ